MGVQCPATHVTPRTGSTITLTGRGGLSYVLAHNLKSHSVRFVDRDMVMRYHWGLGVGHVYAYSRPSESTNQADGDVEIRDGVMVTSGSTVDVDLNEPDSQVEELEGHDDDTSWTLELDNLTTDEDDTSDMDSDLDVLADATYESEDDQGSSMEDSESGDYKF